MSEKLNSVSVIVNGELITINFKKLKTGLEVVKALCEKYPDQSEQKEQDHLEQIKYIRCMSSFVLQQPQFVDVFSNQFDHRLTIPNQIMARTLQGANDTKHVQDLITLSQQTIQQNFQQNQYPSYKQYNYQPINPSQFTSIPPPSIPTIQQQHQQSPVLPVQQQLNPQLNEQIYKLVYQILILVFTKDPNLLVQASKQTNIVLDRADPQQLNKLVKSMTEQLMKLPTKDLLIKLQDFNSIPPEMREKVRQLLSQTNYQQQQQLQQKAIPSLNQQQIQLQQQNIQLQNQATQQYQQQQQQLRKQFSQMQSKPLPQVQQINPQFNFDVTDKQRQEANQVVSQLEPSKISQLIHQKTPVFIVEQLNYKQLDFNMMRINAQGRQNLQLNMSYQYLHSTDIINNVIKQYQNNMVIQKEQVTNTTELSDRIVELFNKNHQNHASFIAANQYKQFHRNFTALENAVLLLTVRGKLNNDCELYSWQHLSQQMEVKLQVVIFEQLTNLVKQHKAPGTQTSGQTAQSSVITSQNNNQMMQSGMNASPGNNQINIPQIQQQTHQQQIQQKPAIKPVIKEEPSQQQGGSDKHQQMISTISQIQQKLTQMSPEMQAQVRDIFNKLINQQDPEVIIICILLIVGLGCSQNLNHLQTLTYLQENLKNIFQQQQQLLSKTSQEKVFIILTGLIPAVIGVLNQKYLQLENQDDKDAKKPQQYSIMGGEKVRIDQFIADYQAVVKEINSLQSVDERCKQIKSQKYFILTMEDYQQILQKSNEDIIKKVCSVLGVQSTSENQAEIKQNVNQGIKNAFGVERSETDEDNM